MNLVELIKRIDSGAYNLIPKPNGWEFEFIELTQIVKDREIVGSILDNEKSGIVEVVSKKEDETICNIATELAQLSSLSLIIDEENLKNHMVQPSFV